MRPLLPSCSRSADLNSIHQPISCPLVCFFSLCLWLTCSCSYHFFSLCQLTTVTIHISLCLSLPASEWVVSHSRLKTYLFTNLSHHRLPSSLRIDSTDFMTRPFLLRFSVFVSTFFTTLFCFVPCGRLCWLFVSFLAHVNIAYHIAYRIISYDICCGAASVMAVLLGNVVFNCLFGFSYHDLVVHGRSFMQHNAVNFLLSWSSKLSPASSLLWSRRTQIQ